MYWIIFNLRKTVNITDIRMRKISKLYKIGVKDLEKKDNYYGFS